MIRKYKGMVGVMLFSVIVLGGCASSDSGSGFFSHPYQSIAVKLGVDLDDQAYHKNGMSWVVRQQGSGEVPKPGQRIKVHYTGYLLDGKKFDSSVDGGRPFETVVGRGRVIRGWDIAFTDMPVGEKRVLFIPPELAYGSRGAGNVIPPNSTLVFDVELLGIVR